MQCCMILDLVSALSWKQNIYQKAKEPILTTVKNKRTFVQIIKEFNSGIQYLRFQKMSTLIETVRNERQLL